MNKEQTSYCWHILFGSSLILPPEIFKAQSLSTPGTGQGTSLGDVKLEPLDEQPESESKQMCLPVTLMLVAQHFSPFLGCVFNHLSFRCQVTLLKAYGWDLGQV